MPNRTESLTIGQVAERVGLRTSALRYYETVGILPVPERVSGQRVYDASIFKHVRLIQAAQVAGFSIEDIKMLLVDSKGSKPFAERLQELARRKLEEVEKLIASVQTMKQLLEAVITCQCSGMEDCLLFVKDDE